MNGEEKREGEGSGADVFTSAAFGRGAETTEAGAGMGDHAREGGEATAGEDAAGGESDGATAETVAPEAPRDDVVEGDRHDEIMPAPFRGLIDGSLFGGETREEFLSPGEPRIGGIFHDMIGVGGGTVVSAPEKGDADAIRKADGVVVFTEDTVRSILRRVLARELAVLREKTSAVEMQEVSKVFNLGALFWNIPTGDDFMDRWATTLGPVIYVPRDFRFSLRGARLVAHEVEHWIGMKREGLTMAAEYLSSPAHRLTWELDAEVARWEAEFYLCGEPPPREELTRVAKHGYGLDFANFGALSESVAMQRLTPVLDGEITTKGGAAFVEAFQAHGIPRGVFASRAEMDAEG